MYLEKKDVSLYYEVRGEGEPLLLIHGAVVDADLYRSAAELLARFYRVITFDRRGNSRSVCKGERTFCMRDQIDDIRDLLEELDIESAYVFGASAGAAIGQCFLQTYPERVRHLIMYEPAMHALMQDEPDVCEWIGQMQELIRRRKYNTAILQFARHIASFDERSPKRDPETSRREMRNHEYMLTQEFPAQISYQPDIEKLKAAAARITVAAGERSGNTVYVRTALRLGEILGKKVLYYPGFHNLPYDLPEEFAMCVLGTLMLEAAHTEDCRKS